MDWHYLPAPGTQRFRILKFPEPGKCPIELLVAKERQEGFLDFHAGSMLVTADGTVYISNDHRIWKVTSKRKLTPVAGSTQRGFADGTGSSARFDYPYGLCSDSHGNVLVAELSGRIRTVSPQGVVTTVAGGQERGYQDGPQGRAKFAQAFGVGVGPEGRVYVAEYHAKREYHIRVISKGQVTTLARLASDGVFVK